MGRLRSKTTAIAGVCFALIALGGYRLIFMRNAVENKIGSVERDSQAARAQDESKISQPASSLGVATERKGVTAQGFKQANALAEKLKQENTQTAQQQNATAKFGTASGEVQVVRTDLDATRQDLANSKKELTGPASEISPSKTVLASVSAVGAVEVRGIPIKQDATIFSGDRVRVGDKGYAKLSFTAGHKIELTEKTDITVTNTRTGVELSLSSGTVGFATREGGSITVRVGGVEMTANEAAAGHIAVLGADSIGVRVVNGGVLLRDIKTKESWTVAAGEERLFSGGTSKPAEPLPQVASNIPPQLPSVPPSQPPQDSPSQSSSRWRRGLLWLFGGAFGAAVVLPGDSARSSFSITPDAERVGSAIAVAEQAQTVAVRLVGLGDQVQAAIGAAQNVPSPTRTDLMSKTRTVVNQAQTSQQRIESLLAQLKQSQASLAVSADPASVQSQIDAIILSLNAEIAVLNELIVQLNNVILTATNAGVMNVPNVDLQTVPMAPAPSRSLP